MCSAAADRSSSPSPCCRHCRKACDWIFGRSAAIYMVWVHCNLPPAGGTAGRPAVHVGRGMERTNLDNVVAVQPSVLFKTLQGMRKRPGGRDRSSLWPGCGNQKYLRAKEPSALLAALKPAKGAGRETAAGAPGAAGFAPAAPGRHGRSSSPPCIQVKKPHMWLQALASGPCDCAE